ncbi:MAG: transglutaminase family protein, partial [Planctomycetota bacterium]
GTLFAAYDAMNLDVYIPDVPAIRGVICEVTVQGDPRGDVFQSSDYHEVTSIKKNGKDVVYRLIMQRYEQKPADPVAFPLELTAEQKTALKTYLEATPLIQSEAEEIKRQARSIVRGTTDAYEAVSRLMHWIHGNLSQQYTDIGSLTALETLRQRKGDCAEHAVLFAAFARSLGIPTRQCSGYVFWGSHGGSHAWCQVKLGDTWVHVDCIGGIMKTAPQYIQFFSEPADGGDIERDREIGKRRSVLSRCPSNLRVVGFVRNGKEVVLTDAARRGSYIDGNTYSHPFAGLTVSKPEAWDWITWGYRQSTYAVMSHDAYTVHVELTSSTPDRARSNLETNYRNVARRENGGAEAEVSEGAARTIGGLEATHLIVRSATRHIELFVAPRKDGAGALVIQVITDIEKLADGDADAPRVPADLDTILSSIVAD